MRDSTTAKIPPVSISFTNKGYDKVGKIGGQLAQLAHTAYPLPLSDCSVATAPATSIRPPVIKHYLTTSGALTTATEIILALKPVTFRFKEEIDAERTPQFGLLAEDVEKVNHDLVLRDAEGQGLYRSLRSGERDVAE
jgi:hypothetical protein